MRSHEIKFTLAEPDLKFAAAPPTPAQKELPDWYKQMDSFIGGKLQFKNLTMKKCVPVADALSTGYLIKTWTDIGVRSLPEGGKDFSWALDRVGFKAVEGHDPDQVPGYPVAEGYDKAVIKFINPWHIKTPRGYSCLFIQPNHRQDLPFYIFPGVVDTDTFPLTINFPAHIRSDFEGIIPYGTPIAQVIPFKRDSFKSVIDLEDDGMNQRLMLNKHETMYTNKYKKLWWHRKEYR